MHKPKREGTVAPNVARVIMMAVAAAVFAAAGGGLYVVL